MGSAVRPFDSIFCKQLGQRAAYATVSSTLLLLSACAPKFNFVPGTSPGNTSSSNEGSSGPVSYQLVFTTEPSSSVTAGAVLPTGGVIKVEDNQGNLISTGALSNATISLSDSSGNGNISGVTSVTASGGVATIPNGTLVFEKAGSTHLAGTATVSGYGTLTGTSGSITISTPSFSTVSLFSGFEDPNGDVNGDGTSARLWYPLADVSDGTYVYVLEGYPNCVIRRYEIASPYTVTTWAGQLYNCGATDGAYGTNTIDSPSQTGTQPGMATDGTNVYFTDYQSIRMASISTGTVTTIAGNSAEFGYSNNSTGTNARFNEPSGLYVNGSTLYVADSKNCRIREITLTAPYAVSTYAGNGTCAESDNSNPLSAKFYYPASLSGDSNNLYVLDGAGYNGIRQVAWSNGDVTTDGTPNCWGGPGGMIAVIGTTMYTTCYYASVEAATIGTWSWSTVAGNTDGAAGNEDGAAGTSLLGISSDQLAITPQGTDLYVTDIANGTLRVLDDTNTLTTVAGEYSAAVSGSYWAQNTTGSASRYTYLLDAVSDGTNLYGYDYWWAQFPVISMSNGSTSTALGPSWGFDGRGNIPTQVMAMIGSTHVPRFDDASLFEFYSGVSKNLSTGS